MFVPSGLLLILVVGLLVFGGLVLIIAAVGGGWARRCPHCGARNRLDARFCARCGKTTE